jgi:hypothetical protein
MGGWLIYWLINNSPTYLNYRRNSKPSWKLQRELCIAR